MAIFCCISALALGGMGLAGGSAAAGIGASLYQMRKQRGAAAKAEREARRASAAAQVQEASERNISAAQEASEEKLPEVEADDLTLAKRRRGVAGTYLNQTLGE